MTPDSAREHWDCRRVGAAHAAPVCYPRLGLILHDLLSRPKGKFPCLASHSAILIAHGVAARALATPAPLQLQTVSSGPTTSDTPTYAIVCPSCLGPCPLPFALVFTFSIFVCAVILSLAARFSCFPNRIYPLWVLIRHHAFPIPGTMTFEMQRVLSLVIQSK